MRILLIEDDTKKMTKIAKIINEKTDTTALIDTAVSLDNAKKDLLENLYDLVVLDIQLPGRIGEDVIADGGVKLLKEISMGRFKTPMHIIGITAYEDTFTTESEKFDDMLYSLIHYDESNNTWEKKLSVKIEQIINNNLSNQVETFHDYDYDVALLCALEKVELESLLSIKEYNWEIMDVVRDETTTYYSGKLETNSGKQIRLIAAAANQMGMVASGVLSTKVIALFKPKYVIMHGITAGVRGKVNLGDIIVASNSWDYNSGKIERNTSGEDTFMPDSYPLRLDSQIARKFRLIASDHTLLADIKNKWPALKPETSLSVAIGDLASGGAVIATPTIVASIKTHARKILGIEMEAYSVFLSADQALLPKPVPIVAKSVCDFADDDKNDSYQNYAAYTSSQIVYHLIKNELDF